MLPPVVREDDGKPIIEIELSLIINNNLIMIEPPPVVSPSIKELMEEVAAKAPKDWIKIGTMLDINQHVLDGFKSQYGPDLMECYLAVFNHWKDNVPLPYTWATIVEVLESGVVQRNVLAAEIKGKYLRQF